MPQSKLKRTVERRMAFIEFRLNWDGRINRNDLAAKFDMSLNQATNDLVRYGQLAPSNMRYDLSQRAYVRGDRFTPHYDITGVAGYLEQLALATKSPAHSESWLGFLPPLEILKVPNGEIDAGILESVVGGLQANEPLDILQQTVNSVEPVWCTVLPLALVHDGERWCVRAYSASTDGYDTAPLARMKDIRPASVLTTPSVEDTEWNTFVSVEIGPNPSLSEADRAVVAKDFGIVNGASVLQLRRAMLPKLLERMGISLQSTGEAKLALLNSDEIFRAEGAS